MHLLPKPYGRFGGRRQRQQDVPNESGRKGKEQSALPPATQEVLDPKSHGSFDASIPVPRQRKADVHPENVSATPHQKSDGLLQQW
jgi:hypothetical protein